MKSQYISKLTSCTIMILLFGCGGGDDSSLPTPTTSTKGSILFWTDNSTFAKCGGAAITVKLSNGQQSNITNYYNSAPANCVNQAGGYFNVDAGTYTYSVVGSNGCTIASGSATAIANQCNYARL